MERRCSRPMVGRGNNEGRASMLCVWVIHSFINDDKKANDDFGTSPTFSLNEVTMRLLTSAYMPYGALSDVALVPANVCFGVMRRTTNSKTTPAQPLPFRFLSHIHESTYDHNVSFVAGMG